MSLEEKKSIWSQAMKCLEEDGFENTAYVEALTAIKIIRFVINFEDKNQTNSFKNVLLPSSPAETVTI